MHDRFCWRNAERLLKNPQDALLESHIMKRPPLVLLWHTPSFAPCRSWGVWGPGTYSWEIPMLRRVTWDPADHSLTPPGLHEGDHEKGCEPKLEILDQELDWAPIESRMESAKRIRIGVVTSDPMVLDGKGFGVVLEGRAFD